MWYPVLTSALVLVYRQLLYCSHSPLPAHDQRRIHSQAQPEIQYDDEDLVFTALSTLFLSPIEMMGG